MPLLRTLLRPSSELQVSAAVLAPTLSPTAIVWHPLCYPARPMVASTCRASGTLRSTCRAEDPVRVRCRVVERSLASD